MAGCSDATTQAQRPAAVPQPAALTATTFRQFKTPAKYAEWWALLQKCSGKTGDLSKAVFYAAPGSEVIVAPGGVALSDQPNHRAYFGIEAWPEQVIVARVLLQELIRAYDTTPFATACADVLNGRDVVLPNTAYTGPSNRQPEWIDP